MEQKIGRKLFPRGIKNNAKVPVWQNQKLEF